MELDKFSTVVDDQRYINPQVALDESNAFIQNLRDTQQARTAEIAQDTYNLGTAVPSNLGGLGGSGSYFAARYQTPQTNALVADLKATAQAQALSDAMNNAVNQAKARYDVAYKAAKKREAERKAAANATGTGTTPGEQETIEGNVIFEEQQGVGDELQAPENPGAPKTEDYVQSGYKFGGVRALGPMGTQVMPTTIDTPMFSTDFDTWKQSIAGWGKTVDNEQAVAAWRKMLDKLGYGG